MIVGVDLGGMSAKAAILAGDKLQGRSRVATSSENSAEETAFALVRLCIEAAEKAGKTFEQVEAIGVGAPGVVNGADGTIVLWSNFGWRDVPLAALMHKFCGKPVFVTNDANAAALGEAKFGAGKAFSDSVLITLGTGVGGGIVLGGKLFEGFRSAGAEIGHTVIRQNGELCSCGRKGCLERYASASALIRMTREEMRRDRGSLLWRFGFENIDGKSAFDAARQGDGAAKRVVEEYVAALGEGVANIVNMLRPQAVILGGGVSAEGERLLAPLREYVYPRLYVSETYAPLEIVCASLGNDAGLYGAAQYALGRL